VFWQIRHVPTPAALCGAPTVKPLIPVMAFRAEPTRCIKPASFNAVSVPNFLAAVI
jgi:hypothetical protein